MQVLGLVMLSSAALAQSTDGESALALMVEANTRLTVQELEFERTITTPGQPAAVSRGAAWFSRGRFLVAYDELEIYDNDRFVFVHHVPVGRTFVYDATPGKYWDIDRLYLADWSTARVIDLRIEQDARRLTLKPEDPDLFRAELWLDLDDHTVQRAIFFMADGTRHAYVINDQRARRRLPARVFTFNPRRHPDVEVLPMTDRYLTEEELGY